MLNFPFRLHVIQQLVCEGDSGLSFTPDQSQVPLLPRYCKFAHSQYSRTKQMRQVQVLHWSRRWDSVRTHKWGLGAICCGMTSRTRVFGIIDLLPPRESFFSANRISFSLFICPSNLYIPKSEYSFPNFVVSCQAVKNSYWKSRRPHPKSWIETQTIHLSRRPLSSILLAVHLTVERKELSNARAVSPEALVR